MRQADGTGWMGFFCLSMLNIALELAKHNSVYEDIASKFFEHFVFIADAMTFHNGEKMEMSLWNDEEGFYFDAVGFPFSSLSSKNLILTLLFSNLYRSRGDLRTASPSPFAVLSVSSLSTPPSLSNLPP